MRHDVKVQTRAVFVAALWGLLIMIALIFFLIPEPKPQFPPKDKAPNAFHTVRQKDIVCYKCHVDGIGRHATMEYPL